MQKAHPTVPGLSWTQRGVTWTLIALAVASVVFWAMQVMGISHFEPDVRFTPDSGPSNSASDSGLARALGGVRDSQTQAPATLVLVAVVNRNGTGAALIASAGQKAQVYQPGDQVQPGRYLIKLGLRSAELGPDPQGAATEVLRINVPELPAESK